MYQEIAEHYQKLYPKLKFSVAKNHAPVLSYWDKIGTPSDTHRWCCSIMKTGPLYRMLKTDDNKQAKVLTFDGVRAEESTRRAGYNRIGKGVKHDTVINARPILNWSTTEIFLYIFEHNLHINPVYRQGMTRVGCLVCPFANGWNEMIANTHYHNDVKPFLDKIEEFASKAGVKDIENYVGQGGWKRRASGNLVDQNSFIDFESTIPDFKAVIRNPKINVLSFLQTLGSYSYNNVNGELIGEIRIDREIRKFGLYPEENKQTFILKNVQDPILVGLIKRVLYKGTYCIHCETCEVECPTGALKVYPEVSIDKNKCIHCHKCLEFHDKGCIVADSLILTTGNAMTSKKGNIDRYKNFGLREEWLSSYLVSGDDFWASSHGLNENYQIPSLKSWLRDAEIIDAKNKITELGKVLTSPKVIVERPDLAWEIVWINLSYNSFIVDWYTKNIASAATVSQKSMEAMLRDSYPEYKEKTVHNAVYQLRRTLKESPIGETLKQGTKIDKDNIQRQSYEGLSKEALAYSIYKFATLQNIKTMRVSDMYKADDAVSVNKEFCTSEASVKRLLHSLNSDVHRVLIAELNMGLDNITLTDDLSPVSVLKMLLGI